MDPIAFTIFGLDVYWYGIIIACGLILALVLAYFIAPMRDFKREDPLEMILWLFPPAIIGARLYFLIFNGGPWGWDAFKIWDGGIAVYGAIIGGAVGAVLYCIFRKKNFFKVADIAVPCVILGQGIGRIGCYFSGCCYGEVVADPNLHFFPLSIFIHGDWHYATMFWECFADLIICAVLVIILKKVKINGIVLSGYLILYGIARAVIEGFRGESLMWGSLRVSQGLSIILIAVGVCLATFLIIKTIRDKRKPKEVLISGKV